MGTEGNLMIIQSCKTFGGMLREQRYVNVTHYTDKELGDSN